jgi:hypothetical protein
MRDAEFRDRGREAVDCVASVSKAHHSTQTQERFEAALPGGALKAPHEPLKEKPKVKKGAKKEDQKQVLARDGALLVQFENLLFDLFVEDWRDKSIIELPRTATRHWVKVVSGPNEFIQLVTDNP